MLLSALDLRNVATSLLRFTVFSRYLRKLEQCREACSGQAGYSRPVRRSEAKEGQMARKEHGLLIRNEVRSGKAEAL